MPLPSIHTERLVLRPWTEDDIDALHQLWIHPDVRAIFGTLSRITRVQVGQAVGAYFESVATRGIGYWSFRLADGEPLMGFCGFRGIEDTPKWIDVPFGASVRACTRT
jgi:RimJ/RimL family protein N-acetyltransferase